MAEESSKIRWLPLESNPEVMNKYIENLGASAEWGFHDVFGFEPELLMMVPRPVAAVVLLYPITEKSESEKIGKEEHNKNLYYMKQTVGNACGTVGIIHALANNQDKIKLDDCKPLAGFLKSSKELDKDARAAALGKDEKIGWCIGDILKSSTFKLVKQEKLLHANRAKTLELSDSLGAAHGSSALEGQTEAPDINAKIDLHFVAFIHCDGGLYEMDGRKDAPMRHGDTTPDTLLEDTVKIVKKFMTRDPDQINFTVSALAVID